MSKLTLECWSRHRGPNLTILLASLHNQTFQDWDLTILEEADCNYLADPNFNGIIRRIKNQGHKVIFLHPRKLLGCTESAKLVMTETKSKYAMKLDDDHMFEMDALEKMVDTLDTNDDVGACGGMLYHIGFPVTDQKEIPSDFNRWTGPNRKIWNDYSTLYFKYPEQIVDVDFVRAPFMYRADALRATDFFEDYFNAGYSPIGFRIESEICNTLEHYLELKSVIHTGSYLWHYNEQRGGCRLQNYDLLGPDGELYYKRWHNFHLEKYGESK